MDTGIPVIRQRGVGKKKNFIALLDWAAVPEAVAAAKKDEEGMLDRV